MDKDYRVGFSDCFYLSYEEGTMPGIGGFTADEVAEFDALQSKWRAWQERLRLAYNEQDKKDDQFRTEEQERKMLATLKAKYG